MREVHVGVCRNHSGADSLVLNLIRAGYYLHRMEHDAKAFVKKYVKCQGHAQLVYHQAKPLHLVLSPWPFMKWGIDIVGPLQPGPRKILSQSDFSGKVFNEVATKNILRRKRHRQRQDL
nr:uncharacterized protein LOC117280087 [Nicotiana tomentosiformis]